MTVKRREKWDYDCRNWCTWLEDPKCPRAPPLCTVGMYISAKCTFKTNVHSAYHFEYYCHTALWPCLPRFDYDCHSVGMFGTFWVLLPHCGHVCQILIMITALLACLPQFDHDCCTVAMFAMFWLWLLHCGHIFCIIATLWQYLSHFEYDCHNVWMFAMF